MRNGKSPALSELLQAATDVSLHDALNGLDGTTFAEMRPAALYWYAKFYSTLNMDDIYMLATNRHEDEMTYWALRCAEVGLLIFPNRPDDWYPSQVSYWDNNKDKR